MARREGIEYDGKFDWTVSCSGITDYLIIYCRKMKTWKVVKFHQNQVTPQSPLELNVGRIKSQLANDVKVYSFKIE